MSLLKLKCIFLAERMSWTYSDDHILLYWVYRHESHMVVNSTMVGDALEGFQTAFTLEM